MKKISLSLAGILLLSSCATTNGMQEAILKRASFDLNCDMSKLSTTELTSAYLGSSRTFGVMGCDKKATYFVQGDGVRGYEVFLNSEPIKK